MITYCVTARCLAAVLDRSEAADPLDTVRKMLESAGLESWQYMEAELFENSGKRLLIARPRTPLCAHPPRVKLRLNRN